MHRITRRRTFALVVITVIIAWMVIIPTRLQSVASAREIGTRLLGGLRGTSPAASAAPAAPRAMFASIVVNTLVDENNTGAACSLREAIVAANTDAAFGGCTAGAGADVITFTVSGTITLSTAVGADLLPPITTQVTINGGGPTNIIINGNLLNGPSGLTRYLLSFSGVGASGSSLINIGVNSGPDGNVQLFETTGVILDNVNLFASRGDGLSLLRSNNNMIRNSRIAGVGFQNNVRDGINLMDSDGNTIFNNDLSTNSDDGIGLETVVPPMAPVGDGSDNNMIFGNVIGPNGDSGINIIGGSDGTIIGGDVTNTMQRNLISANISNGITITDNSNGTQIYGNYIGTNAAGTAADANRGVGILDLNNPGAPTLIGSAIPNQGNVISGNLAQGIAVGLGSTATILGNRIGLAANGTANSISGIGNGLDGIRVAAGSGNVIIGGTAGGNLIAFNGVNSTGTNGNGIGIAPQFTGVATISQNSIFLNTTLGIDLGVDGVTPNDPGDPDLGPNNLTNFPQLTSALISGGFVTVTGIFNSYPSTTFTFELFASDTCDPSTFGEGQRFLGSTTVVTDGAGNATFNFSAPAVAGVNVLDVATITVTPASGPEAGRTSEFSQCRIILLPTDVDFASFNATSYEGGVLAEWSTGFEADNLGFNLYREEGGRKLRVNRELVAGSALSVGARTELRAGQGYGWFDAGAAEGTQYWLEAVDLSGNSAWHGPFAVTRAERRVLNSPWSRRARTLSELGAGAGAADLTAAVEPSATIPRSLTLPRGQEANFAGREAVKVGVRRAGWYRLGQAELVAAGLSPSADPRRLQLHVDGQEVAINVTGAEDGKFDATDAVEFYGMGLETPYTDTRVYWLLAGSEPGRRLGRSEAADGAPAGRSFSYTVERRERTIYFSGLINGEAENFFGAVVRGDPVDQGLVLRHVDSEAGAQAELEVVLQGVTEQEHTVRVSLNGEELQPVTFRGKAQGRAVVRVAHSLLREGENAVTLQGMNGGSDISLVDHVRLTYRHLYRAEANRLSLTAQGGSVVRVGGFTRGDVRIFDVTNARAVVELGAKVAGEGAEYVAEATAAGAGQRLLLAVAGDQSWPAASLRANRASRLRQSAGGDLLVLTHESLAASAEPLIQARNSQGLRAVVADVEDVYDEFSYGHKSVGAVRDFLAHAGRNWRAAPRYLLIVGDASSDPRNYLGFGDQDLVPSLNINTAVVETASDEALADFDGDGLGELMVGRLPAHTAEEAGRMVAKVLAYDRSEGSKEVALVSDVNDTYDFEAANGQVQGQLPAGLRVESIARGKLGDGTARAQLLESLGRGPKVVNYVGHGSVNFWRGNLLTAGDAAGLSNSGLSLFVTMTCLNGYFQDPALESLAEGLIKAPGGAVAVWASSGFTNPGSQEVMDVAVMRELFGSARTLGEAMRRAKASVEDPDVRRSWVLFGDPTSRLK